MKFNLVFLVFCIFIKFDVYSQELEKSIFNVQTGVLGFWVNNEYRIGHHWALHTELGLDGTITNKPIHGGDFPVFLPVISVEPRYFYNLPKRQANSKDIFHNSGNYFSLSIKWYPNWFSIAPTGNSNRLGDDVFIVPTWGIKRNLNWNWNYEIGGGLGLGIPVSSVESGVVIRPVINILLRIGYKFY